MRLTSGHQCDPSKYSQRAGPVQDRSKRRWAPRSSARAATMPRTARAPLLIELGIVHECRDATAVGGGQEDARCHRVRADLHGSSNSATRGQAVSLVVSCSGDAVDQLMSGVRQVAPAADVDDRRPVLVQELRRARAASTHRSTSGATSRPRPPSRQLDSTLSRGRDCPRIRLDASAVSGGTLGCGDSLRGRGMTSVQPVQPPRPEGEVFVDDSYRRAP